MEINDACVDKYCLEKKKKKKKKEKKKKKKELSCAAMKPDVRNGRVPNKF